VFDFTRGHLFHILVDYKKSQREEEEEEHKDPEGKSSICSLKKK